MAGALAAIQDVEDIWQPVDAADQARIGRLLVKASDLLRLRAPHTDARLAAGTLPASVVASVVAGIVKRFLSNPSGASTVSTGPYHVGWVDRYEGVDGTASIRGGLSVTKSDLAALKPYLPKCSIDSIRVYAALAPHRNYAGVAVESDELRAMDLDPEALPAAGVRYGPDAADG